MRTLEERRRIGLMLTLAGCVAALVVFAVLSGSVAGLVAARLGQRLQVQCDEPQPGLWFPPEREEALSCSATW